MKAVATFAATRLVMAMLCVLTIPAPAQAMQVQNSERGWQVVFVPDGALGEIEVAGPRGVTRLMGLGMPVVDARVLANGEAGAQVHVRYGSSSNFVFTHGWRTDDGGGTWQMIAPPAPWESNEAQDAPQELARTDVVTRTQGQGFDACVFPSQALLENWMQTSPYGAVNVYGGPLWACKDQPHTAAQLVAAAGLGWRFIPTWVGPQSRCWGGPAASSRIFTDTVAARVQGETQGNEAHAWAIAMGLGADAVIYYDLEAYPNDAICRAAARAFVDGYSARLRALGAKPGVYGAPCASYLSDFATLAAPPEAVWIAAWTIPYRYRKAARTTGMPCLDDTLWSQKQRLRQYSGGHAQRWGGMSQNLDASVLDGPVVTLNMTVPTPACGDAHEALDARGGVTLTAGLALTRVLCAGDVDFAHFVLPAGIWWLRALPIDDSADPQVVVSSTFGVSLADDTFGLGAGVTLRAGSAISGVVEVRDAIGKGGPLRRYRLEIVPVRRWLFPLIFG